MARRHRRLQPGLVRDGPDEAGLIGGATVLANAGGFTLYWFAPDTPAKSNCNGSCATFWPPVKGPATPGQGVTGKLGASPGRPVVSPRAGGRVS